MTSKNSFLRRIANVPKAAPVDKDPTSPMKTSAGAALNQRYPIHAPTQAAEKIVNSPTPGR